jgi:hypothetical protein
MSLIGVDLTIPTDTDMNRNPRPRAVRQTSSKKLDPEPQSGCRSFHPPPFQKKSKKKSAFAEYKQSTVSYSLGEEAGIEDMAIFSPQEHVAAVGCLANNDYAFVRRSGGKFCFAMIKSVRSDAEEGIIMDLYVNEAGATKSIPVSEWGHYIRPVKQYVVCNPLSVVIDLGGSKMGGSKRDSSGHTDRDQDIKECNDHRLGCSGRSGNRRASCPDAEAQKDPSSIADCQKEMNTNHRRTSTNNRRFSCPEAANNTIGDYSKSRHVKKGSQEYNNVANLRTTQHNRTELLADESVIPRKRSPNVGMNSSEIKSRPREIKHTKNLAEDDNGIQDQYRRNRSDLQENEGKHNFRKSVFTTAGPADFLDRHFKPIGIDDQFSHILIDEHLHDDPIRQYSENTGTTAESSFRSSIATNYGSFVHKSSMMSNQSAIDEVHDESAANNDSFEDDVSRHVKWDVASKSQIEQSCTHVLGQTCDPDDTPATPNFLQTTPVIPDTNNTKPTLRKVQTEHESDKTSFLAKQHRRRSTANGNNRKESKEKLTKKHHSRRATVGAGLSESQKFNESQLLSAFAAIQTKSKLEDID